MCFYLMLSALTDENRVFVEKLIKDSDLLYFINREKGAIEILIVKNFK